MTQVHHARAPRTTKPRLAVLALVVVLALVASSCARQLPTAPLSSATHREAGPAQGFSEDHDITDDVVVTLAPGTDPAAVASDHGATLLETDGDGSLYAPASGVLPDTLAAQLARDPRVVTSERDAWMDAPEARQRSFAFDDGGGTLQTYLEQPGTEAIHLAAAQRASQGEGVRVAILDTGADLAHPALAGRIAGGWDFVRNGPTPTDAPDGIDSNGDGVVDGAWGHGTHVAGIVALTAPRARLLIARVLDSDGRGDVLDVAAGIRWAVAQGARVINLSLGMLKDSDAIQNALDAAEEQGVLCVASAGNWGAASPQEFPAKSSHASAIAAVDAQDHPTPFTSYGSFVALCAPGAGIRSAYPGGGYRLWSGTSMSAPFVSGTAALLLAVHPSWTTEEVVDRMEASAAPLTGDLPPGLASNLGHGALDAGAALLGNLTVVGDPPPGDPATVTTDR